jgi:hypothetical protein
MVNLVISILTTIKWSYQISKAGKITVIVIIQAKQYANSIQGALISVYTSFVQLIIAYLSLSHCIMNVLCWIHLSLML